MSKELAITNFQEMQDMAKVFVSSGMFPSVKSQSQAIVRIMAGKELGIGPFAAMRGIYIIGGRTALESNILANLIKSKKKYNYRIKAHTNLECSIDFLENGEVVGNSTFTMQDAKTAGLANKDGYKKYPRNMLFGRALSNGARWFCPDIYDGPIYSVEEAQEIEQQEEIQAELTAIDDAAAEDEARMRAANSERMEAEKLDRAVETGEYILEFGSYKGQAVSKATNSLYLERYLNKYGPDLSEAAHLACEAKILELKEEYRAKLDQQKAEEQALGAGADLEAELEY